MTFWAQQAAAGDSINVHITHGPVTITVNEHPGHLRSFWRELDKLLTKAENTPAETAG